MQKKAKKAVGKALSEAAGKLKRLVLLAVLAAVRLAAIAAVIGMIVNLPQMHNQYLRHSVGSKVYMILNQSMTGGGTGFAIKAPSGATYLLTNSHVCEHTQTEAGKVLVADGYGFKMERRVLEISDKTDLCLVEGVPSVEGLRLGSRPHLGDELTVVGHPELRPMSLSKGEVVGATDVRIIDHIMPTGDPLVDSLSIISDKPCDKLKQELVDVQVPELGTIHVCYNITKKAYATTAVIYGGNSGSPAVDYWGRVVGVAFAANDRDNWADLVNLGDIRMFINNY